MKARNLFLLLVASPALAFAQSDTAKAAPKPVPFDWADWTWLTGNARTKDSPLDSKLFTGEFRLDATYLYDFNNPKDHTLAGSSEQARTQEFQVTQLGVGGDFHYDNVRGRLMTQFGMYSRADAAQRREPGARQWNLADAYRYISEAYGGYHFDNGNGINVDAGIFMSYVGLYSYYNFDNWSYQPSYVSSNTPWFFNGVRIQTFPTQKLKLEYWIINGWQSYGMFNSTPGLGTQVLYRPNREASRCSRTTIGATTRRAIRARMRIHSDNSIEVKYFEDSTRTLSKARVHVTVDAGCENGGGVSCSSGTTADAGPVLPRLHGLQPPLVQQGQIRRSRSAAARSTIPAAISCCCRPINGATATYRHAVLHGESRAIRTMRGTRRSRSTTCRASSARCGSSTTTAQRACRTSPGPGGVTPPGGNTGAPGSTVTLPSGAIWTPDLRKAENRMTLAMLIKL